MSGRIESGQLVTLAPFADREPTVNDIVLVRVKGSVFLHLIKAQQDDRFLIGNNKGGTNGWTSRKNIFGFVLRIDP